MMILKLSYSLDLFIDSLELDTVFQTKHLYNQDSQDLVKCYKCNSMEFLV